MTWVVIGWFAMIGVVALLLTWMRWTGRHLAEPLPRTLLRSHCCADFTTTTEGDGLPRCYPCYRKEWRRAKFCGEEWPNPEALFLTWDDMREELRKEMEACRARRAERDGGAQTIAAQWPKPEGPGVAWMPENKGCKPSTQSAIDTEYARRVAIALAGTNLKF